MEHNIIQFRISHILDEMQNGGEDDCGEKPLPMGNVRCMEMRRSSIHAVMLF
jgi:hypothetical protein